MTKTRTVRAYAAPSAAAFVLVAALTAMQWGIDGNGRADLRIYYRSVTSMGSGHLYDYGTHGWNFLYPPAAALVLAPLGLVGEDAATRVWLVVSIGVGLLALGAALWALDAVVSVRRIPRRWIPAAAAVGLWSIPAFLSLQMGQINPLIAALVALDAVALTRRSRWGGLAIGVAAALKVTPLLLIVALVWSGRRRDAGRAALSFVVAGLVGLAVLPDETARFWSDVVFGASTVGGRANPLNASLYSVAGLVTDHAASATALWLAASGMVMIGAAATLRHRFADDVIGAVTMVMCVTYLVSPLTWVHHQWFATVALAMLGSKVLLDPFLMVTWNWSGVPLPSPPMEYCEGVNFLGAVTVTARPSS